MRKRFSMSALGVLLLVATLGSCGRGAGTEPEVAIAGNYTLQQVEGQPLPYPFTSTELLRGEITGGSLTLEPDMRYQWSVAVLWTLGTTPDTTQLFTRSGTYQRTGNQLLFTAGPGLTITGTADGTTVVVQQELQDVPNALTYTFVRAGGG